MLPSQAAGTATFGHLPHQANGYVPAALPRRTVHHQGRKLTEDLNCPQLSRPQTGSDGVTSEARVAALREEALQREEASILQQISLARAEEEHVQIGNRDADVVQLADWKAAVPEAQTISVDDKLALFSQSLEHQATKTAKGGKHATNANGEQDLPLSSRSTTSDAPVGKSDVLEILSEMEHLESMLVAERHAKTEMVERFEQLFQDAATDHARDVGALETNLAAERQRSVQLMEMKRQMEESHARDVALLEGMVQRVLEDNGRLAADVKMWRAAASRRRNSIGVDSSNVSTSSGDELGSTSPDVSVRMPGKSEEGNSSDESTGASPELAVRMPADVEEDSDGSFDPVVSEFLERTVPP